MLITKELEKRFKEVGDQSGASKIERDLYFKEQTFKDLQL